MKNTNNVTDKFADHICNGLENASSEDASVRITIVEEKCNSAIINLRSRKWTRIGSNELHSNSSIRLPAHTALEIIENADNADLRDPSIIGNISFSGDLGFCNTIAKACLRPSDWIKGRFTEAEARHKKKNLSRLDNVERYSDISELDLIGLIEADTPFVIENHFATCDGQPWCLDKLNELFSDAIVRVRSATERQTMNDFIQQLKEYEGQAEGIEGFTKPYTEGAALPAEMYSHFGPLYFDADDHIAPQLETVNSFV